MALQFNHKPQGSIVGESSYVFTHYGEEEIPPPVTYSGLCLTANTAGSTVELIDSYMLTWTGSYSTDGETWIEYIPSGTGAITLANIGDKVYFKGTYPSSTSKSNFIQFVMSGSIAASGNIMSLCNEDDFESATTIPYGYMFYNLFSGCDCLTTPPSLPATTISAFCYGYMFSNCTSLTTAPNLPASTLASSCYYYMFRGCTSLQVSDTQTSEAQYAWRIPTSSTFTNTSSQRYMFRNCAGTRSSSDMAGAAGASYTYYTQNEPV